LKEWPEIRDDPRSAEIALTDWRFIVVGVGAPCRTIFLSCAGRVIELGFWF
jgi:hypothetical protein